MIKEPNSIQKPSRYIRRLEFAQAALSVALFIGTPVVGLVVMGGLVVADAGNNSQNRPPMSQTPNYVRIECQ